MAGRTRLTPDDLWRLGDGDVRRELVDGEIVEMAPSGGQHGIVLSRLVWLLADYVYRTGIGKVLSGDVGFVLDLPEDRGRVRAPDIAFMRSVPADDGFVPAAPDLAIEILSPSESPIQIQEKIRDYLEAGTSLIWVVAPKAKTVTVYRPDGSARFLREHETLAAEDLLPGLSIPLTEIFVM
jgi:Uma2 family endonuclease